MMLAPEDPVAFASAAARIGAALAGGLGVIVVAERRRLRRIGSDVLFVRWRTWLFAAPLYLVAVPWSKWSALCLVVALAAQGSREYASLVFLARPYRVGLIVLAATSPIIALARPDLWPALPGFACLAGTLLPVVRQDVRRGAREVALATLGYTLVPWALGFALLIRERTSGGIAILIAVGSAVALSDVFAFAVGTIAGRRAIAWLARPLAPALSPAKTRAGLLGNLIGAVVGWGLMRPVLPGWLGTGGAWALPLAIAVAALWGDLVESLLKRAAGVKDAGSCLPGFGGLLDRIDSLLPALPVCWLVVEVLR